MFVSTPNNQVLAIDAKSGNVLWRYRRVRPAGASVPHDTSRGVALFGDRVFFAAGEAVLVALDAQTGKEVWTTTKSPTIRPATSISSWLAAGGERKGDGRGIRRRVWNPGAASSPDSISRLARNSGAPTRSPLLGEPGSETWPQGRRSMDARRRLGLGHLGNYDPDTNLAYWGVGNGVRPWMER